MATTTYTAPTNVAPIGIEGRSESSTLHVRGHGAAGSGETVLTPAGIAAIVATLDTYYGGLTGTQLTTLGKAVNGQWLKVSAAAVEAAVLPADHATVAASLATNVKASGNTTHG